MKAGKDGKLKLSKNERQYGNFVFKNEERYVKICDINGNMTHRISKDLNMGRMIEIAMRDRQDVWLENYATLVWVFSNVVTDEQFFIDIDAVCRECMLRHPEIYGIDTDIDAEKDAEILEDTRKASEELEKLSEE